MRFYNARQHAAAPSDRERCLVLEMSRVSRIIQLIETREITGTEYRSSPRCSRLLAKLDRAEDYFVSNSQNRFRTFEKHQPDLILNSVPGTHWKRPRMIVRDSRLAPRKSRELETRGEREKERKREREGERERMKVTSTQCDSYMYMGA